jgi:broad specificity phosphatase PhoE
MTAVVLLLRHGETALNVSGALRGRLDAPLTDRGHRQAEALAARIGEEYVVSQLFSSPLMRAVDTAAHIAARWRLLVRPHEGFIDVDYGRWAGLAPAELSEADAIRYRRWERAPTQPHPGAEAPQRVRERALAALNEVAIDAEVVAVVSHDAVLQLTLAAILQLPLGSYRGLCQSTATLNEVRRTGGAWSVVLLNSTWHLASLDAPAQRHDTPM